MSKEFPKPDAFSRTLKTTAQKRFGITIPEQVTRNWSDIVRAGLRLDKLYDYIPEKADRLAFYQEVKNYLSKKESLLQLESHDITLLPKDRQKIKRLKIVVQNLSEENKTKFLNRLDRFILITERMREERDSAKFRKLRRIEGNVWAGFFYDVLPEEITTHPHFAQYKRVIDAFARSGNSMDQAKDLWSDSSKNKVSVEGIIVFNSSLLLKDAVYEGLHIIKYLLSQKAK